jgi:enoyl-CoA hydratase
MGLVDRLTEPGGALDGAGELARQLAALPQTCMRSDRLSAIEQWGLTEPEALRNEVRRGVEVLAAGDVAAGAARFAEGAGRHGERA